MEEYIEEHFEISYEDMCDIELEQLNDDPIKLFDLEYLKIEVKNPDGREGVQKFILNQGQKMLLNKIIELRKQRKPIRIWLLKARQIGYSTFCQALIYMLTRYNPNRTSLVMADDESKSNNLFRKTKLYHEHLCKDEPHLGVDLVKSNEKKLEFEGMQSQIRIGTGNNPEQARSFTYHYVHLSEVAFMDKFKDILKGLLQSVPKYWDTFIIGETTANGMNDFHKEWLRAKTGKTDWIPFFVPWYVMEEYTKSLEETGGKLYDIEEGAIKFKADFNLSDFYREEKEIKAKYNLTDGQLNWRRYMIVNDCLGDMRTFRQEYPITDEEAFCMSGDQFFEIGLDKQEVQEPIMGEVMEIDGKFEFIGRKGGRVKFYEFPDAEDEYVVTVDTSKGGDGDDASILCLNKHKNETACVVYGSYDVEELEKMATNIANYYNMCMIVPEVNTYGWHFTKLCLKHYGNIYYHGDKSKPRVREKYGFNTTKKSRDTMLLMLKDEIKQETTKLLSERLLDECRTFVKKYNNEGEVKKVEGSGSEPDGLVICRAMASYVRNEYPPQTRAKQMIQKRNLDTMYYERKRLGVRSRLH